jgi:hypothetical protein
MDEETNKEKKRKYDQEYRKKNRGKKNQDNKAFRDRNKEKLKLKSKEYYEKNKEATKLRVNRYAQKNATHIKEYHNEYYQKKRLEVLAKIDPNMKCAMCGCDDTKFLEINHIEGGGRKEYRELKKTEHNSSLNLTMLIHKGKRGVKDLNLLCSVCNSIDHLERVYGKTGLRTVWDKQVN